MQIIGQFSESRDNNFNLIRVIAASLVLVSHAYPISLGPGTIEPLETLLGVTLGTLAVYVFFVISGFLIAQSFDRSSTTLRFLLARALRIFPALILVLLLTALLLGPFYSDLSMSEYFSSPAAPLYVLRNLSLAFLVYELPGVFATNPYGGAINGSLWTLFYEVACYFGVLVAGLAGALRKKWMMGAALIMFAGLYFLTAKNPLEIDLPYRIILLTDLALPFAIGTAFYVWRATIPLNWAIGFVLAALCWLLADSGIFHEILVVCFCYWTFLLGYLPGGILRNYNRIGDYSYGIYIYAFPMQQIAAFHFSPMEPVLNMLIAAPATLLFAIFSWHLVEKPALTAKSQIANRIQKNTV